MRPKSEDSTKKSEGPKLSLYRNSAEGIDVDMPATTTEDKRHSDSSAAVPRVVEQQPHRRYHAKSLSLSENRVALGAAQVGVGGVFHQNRELWQQRATGKSTQSLTTPRILSRNRIAPDLVMDLPVASLVDAQRSASHESLDSETSSDDVTTSAERFASQNQCTLKKNERFGDSEGKKEVKLEIKCTEKPKAEVKPQENVVKTPTIEVAESDVLHIEEGIEKREVSKSPIPLHNTQKFASQFAGLHLTGGCLSKADSVPSSSSQPPLSSFKPQVKVKPQILKKPLVLPPTTPELVRRSTQE